MEKRKEEKKSSSTLTSKKNIQEEKKVKFKQSILKRKPTTKPESKSSPKVPVLCCLSDFFFCQFNRIINIGRKKPIRKDEMFQLPPGINGYNVLPKALKVRKNLQNNAKDIENHPEKHKRCCSWVGKKFDFMNLSNLNSAQAIIFEIIKPKIKKAIILRILEKFIILLISLIPLMYLPQLKKPEHLRKDLILYYCPLIALLLTFLRGILKEHSSKFLCQCGSATGQTLRSLFYDKIINSNISFLENADSSIIAKITLFEINKISDFVGKVPDVVSFPATLAMSAIAMVYFISWSTLMILFVFMITWIILVMLAEKQSYYNERKEYFGSRRALKINEILKNLEQMKCSSMENYMNESIKQLRKREINCIKRSNNFKKFASFVMSISPIGAILIIIMIEKQVIGRDLTVTQTFAIVSIVNNLSKPLREFVTILDQYYFYKHAVDALNKILFVFSLKPDDAVKDEGLRVGEILMENCAVEIEDANQVLKRLGNVFGDHVNVERELKEASMNMARISKLRMGTQNLDDDKIDKARKQARKSIFGNIKKGVKSGLKGIKGGIRSGISSGFKGLKGGIKTGLSIFTNKKEKQIMDIERVKLFKDINLKINPGENIILIGDSNQQLTEFLYSILGETFIPEGSIRYNGEIYYLDGGNPSFLVNKSLRDNIIFGEKFLRKKYKKILATVELDIEKYEAGDMMQIMSKGKNLSKFEKLKILIARALYQPEKDIYIFNNLFMDLTDDVIMEVSRKILKDFFMKKTLIFRSGSRGLAKLMNRVIVFSDKKIVYDGNPADFILKFPENKKKSKGSKLKNKTKRIMKAGKMKGLKLPKIKEIPQEESEKSDENEDQKFDLKKLKTKFPNKSLLNLMTLKEDLNSFKKKTDNEKQTFNEDPAYENIYKLMKDYIFYGGKTQIIGLLLLYTISVCLFVSVDLWAGAWSFNLFKFSINSYMLFYIILTLAAGLFVIIRDNFFYNVIMKNTNKVHDLLTKNLLRLKIRWFNITKKTRISYKLSYDINLLDTKISYKLQDMLESFMFCVAGMLILNYVFFGIMAVITVILYIYISRQIRSFLKTTQAIMKYKGEYSAELRVVYNYINNEILNFRLSDKGDLLKNLFMDTTNELQRSKTHIAFYCSRWLGVRMIVFNTTLMTFAYIIPLIFLYFLNSSKFFERSILELAFATSWSLKITDYFIRFINAMIKVYTDIVSFGRMKNFAENCTLEDNDDAEVLPSYLMKKFLEDILKNEIKKKILNLGNNEENDEEENLILMENVDLTLSCRKVMNNITFRIKEGEKIILAGGPGAGKTTLFKLIMNLFDKDPQEKSRIKFFNLPMKKVNPRMIRSKISYLETNPVVFSGSVRENIDPDHTQEEDDLVKILKEFGVCELIGIKGEKGKEKIFFKKSVGGMYQSGEGEGEENNFDEFFGAKKVRTPEKFVGSPAKKSRKTDYSDGKIGGSSLNKGDGEISQEGNEEKKNFEVRRVTFKGDNLGESESKVDKMIKLFLKEQLNAKLKQVPLSIRKLIKAVKTYLEKPKIVLIHQLALDFNKKKSEKIVQLFSGLNEGKTTLIMSMKEFKDVLNWERALVLEDGCLVEDGKITDLLRSRESTLSRIIQKSNKRVFEKLFVDLKEVLVTERERNEVEESQDGYADLQSEDVQEKVLIADPRFLKNELMFNK